jgi:hypothetical protein
MFAAARLARGFNLPRNKPTSGDGDRLERHQTKMSYYEGAPGRHSVYEPKAPRFHSPHRQHDPNAYGEFIACCHTTPAKFMLDLNGQGASGWNTQDR